MDINRVQFDIQGSTYTLPINPVQYEHLDDIDVTSSRTIDGRLVRFTNNFDSRQRTMKWENIPNTSEFQDMVLTLRSAVGLSGVKINHKGLSIFSNIDYWEDIRIDDVYYFFSKDASHNATSKLKYDIEMKFSYVKHETPDATVSALFTYQPLDYTNPVWLANVSGLRGMDVIICHPDIDLANCNGLRAAFPNAYLLTYYDIQNLHIRTYAGNYWSALNASVYAFSGYTMKWIGPPGPTAGQILSLGGAAPTQLEGVLSKPLADRVLVTVSGNCMGVYNSFQYDGVYLDDANGQIEDWKEIHYSNWINISGFRIDCDNDGSAETVASIQSKYAAGKNYFISGLRRSLPNKIIIANVGSAMDSFHPDLNGITIENIGQLAAATPEDSQRRFMTQNSMSSYTPKINIAWAIAATASGSVRQFCSIRPDIRYGYYRGYWAL